MVRENRNRSDEFEDISDLKSDISEFKRAAVQVLVAAAITGVGYGIWVGTIQKTVSDLVTEFVDLHKTQRELEIKSATSEIRLQSLEQKKN